MQANTNSYGKRAPLNRGIVILSAFVLLVSALMTSNANSAPGDNMIIPRQGDDSGMYNTPPSIFPHWIHRARYRCDACHDDLFEMKLGASEISMDLMKEGKSCGICHNEKADIAFPVGFDTCDRCHREPSE